MGSGNESGDKTNTSVLALSHRDDPIGDNSIKVDVRPFKMPKPESGIPAETAPLRTIFLHVTKACNLSCRYCYFSANKSLPDEMTRVEYRYLWRDIVNLQPKKVVFTGGEPILRKDILQLLRDLRDADPHHNVLRCLNTNGYLITPSLAGELVGLVDEVRVSLDALAERNDMLRGKGSFDAAVRALDYLYAVGFEPKVLVTLTSISVPDLKELLCFLIAKGITRINLNPFRPIGYGVDHPDLVAMPSDVDQAVQQARKECYQLQLMSKEPANPAHINCGIGSFLNIVSDGDVFPCHALMIPEFRCGNVRQQSLTEICHRHSLLGKLKELNFRQLALQDKRLTFITGPNICLGSMFERTRSLRTWHKILKILSNVDK